jgi:hypothetical protein
MLTFALVLGGIGQGGLHPAHGAVGHAEELAEGSASVSHAQEALPSTAGLGHCQGSADGADCIGVSGCAFCAPPAQNWQPDQSLNAPTVPGSDTLRASLTASPPTPPPKLSS